MSKLEQSKTNYDWEISVPIFGNNLIRKQLLLAFGIPFVAIFLFVKVLNYIDGVAPSTSYNRDLKYALFLLGITIFLSLAILYLLNKNKYNVHYTISNTEIHERYQKAQAKKNKVLNFFLIIAGIFSRKPLALGSAAIVSTSNDRVIEWSEILTYKTTPKNKSIILVLKSKPNMVVFCTEQIYDDVLELIKLKIDNN